MVNQPNLADIKRELENRIHELEDYIKTQPKEVDEVKQALYRIKEAITHVTSAQAKAE